MHSGFFGLSKYSPVLCSLPGVVDECPGKAPCDWKCPAIVANPSKAAEEELQTEI
jgi:hypothetical protein